MPLRPGRGPVHSTGMTGPHFYSGRSSSRQPTRKGFIREVSSSCLPRPLGTGAGDPRVGAVGGSPRAGGKLPALGQG